jgi:hypothetical protein
MKFSNGCEQVTGILAGGIDSYLAESGGNTLSGIEKDF